MKFNKKFYIILALALVAGALAWISLRSKAPAYKTAKVTRGAITQEISETGTIKKGDAINLSFKNSGTIAKINVSEGEKVAQGHILAELDTRQLNIQLAQAQASLVLYQAQLDKAVNGAGSQDVNLTRTSLQNAQTGADSANQSLADVQANARQKIDAVYKSADNALSGAYAKAYNAQNFAGLVQRTYFVPRDDDSIKVWETTQKMSVAASQIKTGLDAARASGKGSDFDAALLIAKSQLGIIDGGLQIIRQTCEKLPWRDSVSTTDKNSLDTQRDYVVAALSAVDTSRANIDLQESANDIAINTAQAAVTAAQGVLKTAKEQLEKITAAPRIEDIDVLNAQIAQAQAQVDLLGLQISDSQLKAPVSGQIVQINNRAGETVSLLASGSIVLLPDDPFEIEVDVYEEDVAKEKIGNPVTITPVSEPDNVYAGRVVSIDPSSKLVNGVVYYSTKIAFEDAPAGLKPGMSADITITTASKDNVLLLPEAAIQKNSDGFLVQILKNGIPQNAKVEVGIRSKGMAEIISGVNEGEEAVVL